MKYLVPLLILFSSSTLAQKITIHGIVKDENNGENLIGASLYNLKTSQGTITNNYGLFSLTLQKDSVHLRVSYVGYKTKISTFYLQKDTTIQIELANATYLNEVVVKSSPEEKIQESSRMGTIDMPIDQIKAMPALLGEVDVFKVLQLLPGVQAGAEGSSGLYVRGGGPDQNLILLDGVPVYNASHLFGFFSVFNADAINHVELIKGGFPARYGGRLSSVIDINMKEGNSKKWKGEASTGLVASKITLEGPLKKDKTSFIISARRTYIDLIARPLIKNLTDDQTVGYYFYDFNTKINHRINDNNRLFLSAYLGNDKAYSRFETANAIDGTPGQHQDFQHTKENTGLQWGNITTAFRWNSILSKKLFSNVTATYSRYRFNIYDNTLTIVDATQSTPQTTSQYFSNEYTSGIRDLGLKVDFDFLPNPRHYIKFGAQGIQHLFTPGVSSYKALYQNDTTIGQKKVFAKEFYVYAEDDFLISENLKINYGLHASGFSVNAKLYSSLQPRISGRYLLNEKISLKASYAQMTQYIHLLTNAGIGLPTDLWVPATENVGPEKSFLSSAGFAYSPSAQYELSLEGYYKEMKGLIEYKDGASYLDSNKDWQTKVVEGNGKSYGAEFFLHKKTGRLSGWIGYTLSWNYRTFKDINDGNPFPYRYDRRHDIKIALAYKLKKNCDLALTWVYGTGAAISLPVSSYQTSNGDVDYYPNRNSFRMRPYHRLDLSFTKRKQTKWGERSWSISVYNAYNRQNPFYMNIGADKYNNKKFIQYSLFPIIPSIAYHFNF